MYVQIIYPGISPIEITDGAQNLASLKFKQLKSCIEKIQLDRRKFERAPIENLFYNYSVNFSTNLMTLLFLVFDTACMRKSK